MSNLLGVLDVFIGIFTSVSERLQLPSVIIGIACAIIGLSIAILARRIVRIIRKNNNVPDDDKALIAFKAVGLVFLFAALMVLYLF